MTSSLFWVANEGIGKRKWYILGAFPNSVENGFTSLVFEFLDDELACLLVWKLESEGFWPFFWDLWQYKILDRNKFRYKLRVFEEVIDKFSSLNFYIKEILFYW